METSQNIGSRQDSSGPHGQAMGYGKLLHKAEGDEFLMCNYFQELDGVGPVDNRHSTD